MSEHLHIRLPFSQLTALKAMSLPILCLCAGIAAAADIEEVLVTSTRLEETIPLELSQYGNRVEVVTAEDIRRHGFMDVGQTLQMLVPGLHIRPKNGPFDYVDASLQGSRKTEILWLIDGVRITNRLYNGTSPLDTIPVHMIERIEVLKGGQGIFYGTQSVGGVVNIVTLGLQGGADGALGTSASSNGGYSANAYYRAGNERQQWLAYASRDQARGYQPYREADLQPSATDTRRGYEVNTGGFKYALRLTDNSRVSLQLQHTENVLDDVRPYRNQHSSNARKENILTLKYDWQLNEDIGFFVKGYRHSWDTRYTRIENQVDEQGNLTGERDVLNRDTYWGYEDYGLNAMARLDFQQGFEYVLGLDHQNFSGQDEVWRIGDQKEEVNALFAQLRTTADLLPATRLALGLRRNEPSHSEASTVWNLSGRQELGAQLFVTANLGTSFRLPDAEALFLNEYYDLDNDGVADGGWFAIGNPDLQPEQSRNLNLSFGGDFEHLSFELIAFKRDITNYINPYVPITLNGVEGETFMNSEDQVDVEGFELISNLALNESWSAMFSYHHTRSRLNNDGAQLTGIPENELKARVDYTAPALPLGLSLTLNHVGALNAGRGEQRGHYTLLDLSAFYHLGRAQQHELVLRLENLGNEVYASSVAVGTRDASGEAYLYDNLGMRRTVHLGYTYRF